MWRMKSVLLGLSALVALGVPSVAFGQFKPEYDEFEKTTSVAASMIELKSVTVSGSHQITIGTKWPGKTRTGKVEALVIIVTSSTSARQYTETDLAERESLVAGDVKFSGDEEVYTASGLRYHRSFHFDRPFPVTEHISLVVGAKDLALFAAAKSQKIKIHSNIMELDPVAQRALRQFLRAVEVMPPVPPCPNPPTFDETAVGQQLRQKLKDVNANTTTAEIHARERIENMPDVIELRRKIAETDKERNAASGQAKLDASSRWTKLRKELDQRIDLEFFRDEEVKKAAQLVADVNEEMKQAWDAQISKRRAIISAWEREYGEELPVQIVK